MVDDDPAALDVLGFTLGKEGYRVIQARTGEEALEQARAHRPQAITLDVLMPRMDGWSVLMALKADPDLRDIPVVVVTILKERGVAFSLGALDFMTKPVDRAALTAMLRRHCPVPGARPVLLIEDDPPTREATRRLLEKLGLAVAEAAQRRGGPRVARRQRRAIAHSPRPHDAGHGRLRLSRGDAESAAAARHSDRRADRQAADGRGEAGARRPHRAGAGQGSNLDLELTEAIRQCLLRSRVTRPRQGGDSRPAPRVA